MELQSRRLARTSFADFCRYVAPEEPPARHHLLICEAADKIIAGTLKRCMILMPPGSAKSTYATVRFPAYFLGRTKTKDLITASFGDELAELFGGRVRDLIRDTPYRAIFPDIELSSGSQAKGEWSTTSGGNFFAAGVGGAVMGRRADLVVVDDPIRSRADADSETIRETLWQWYMNSLRTRMKPGAALLLIQTRWHMDDLAGRILPESWEGESGWIKARDGEDWLVISLPAEARENDVLGRKPGQWLWTDWFDEAFWEQTKRTALLSDVRTWNSLYQQVPADEAGTYFQRAWFEDRYEVRPEHLNVYLSGDFAVTEGDGDFTELAAWGVGPDDRFYVLDWWSGQTTSDVWIAALLEMNKRWGGALRFIGEMGPIRRAVEPFLERSMRDTSNYVGLEWLSSGGDKAANARSFQALASQRRIVFPRTEWAERVINQLCRFPAGKYDDAVDTCGLFGRFIASTWEAVTPPPPPKDPDWDAPLRISDLLQPVKPAKW